MHVESSTSANREFLVVLCAVLLRLSGEMSNEPAVTPKPRHVWPWILLAGIVLGAVLAVIWLSAEVRRVREQRQYDFAPPAGTNAVGYNRPG